MSIRLSALSLALGALAGCASPDDYPAEYATAYCSLAYTCASDEDRAAFGWTAQSDCEETARTNSETQAEGASYNKINAKDCLDGLAALTCDTWSADAVPISCQLVWE